MADLSGQVENDNINPKDNSDTMLNKNKSGKVQSLFSNEMTDLDLAYDGGALQATSGPKKTPTKKSSSYKKGKTRKPDGMPRRPLSAYNLFFKEQREIIIAERTAALPPEQLKGRRKTAKISFEELAKIIGSKWKAISPTELQRFKSMAEEESRTYKIQMEQYLRSSGHKAERSMSLPQMTTSSTPRGPPRRSNSSFSSLSDAERSVPYGAPVSAAINGMDNFFRGMRTSNNTSPVPSSHDQQHYQVVSFDYRRSFSGVSAASYPPAVPSGYPVACHVPSSTYEHHHQRQHWRDDASQGSSVYEQHRAPSPILSQQQLPPAGAAPLVNLQNSSAAMMDTLLDDAPLRSIQVATTSAPEATVTPESQREELPVESKEPSLMMQQVNNNDDQLFDEGAQPEPVTDMSWMEPRPIAPVPPPAAQGQQQEQVVVEELLDFDPLDISAGLELDDLECLSYSME